MKLFVSPVAAAAALWLGLVVPVHADAQESELDRKVRAAEALSPQQPSAPDAPSSSRATSAVSELVQDGGFESGPSGSPFTTVSTAWTWQYSGSSGTPSPRYNSPSSAHTGTWSIYFDLGVSADRLSQNFFIPSGAATTLSFWLRVTTVETSTLIAFDTFKVTVTDLSGSVSPASTTYSNLDATGLWIKHTFDISAYAGKTVRLQFDTSEDSTRDTLFFLDDVSVLASTSSACVEDSFTMCLANGRYRITSHWRNQYAGGATANLSKAKLTDVTGAFWIADSSTYEYLIRLQPGQSNGRTWIAIPTFTDVEFWVLVTDTINGQSKEYHSNPGNQSLIYDPFYFIFP